MGISGVEQKKIACIIGVLPEERTRKQDLYVDFKVCFDFAPAGNTDQLSAVVDYRSLSSIIEELAQHNKYQLLEAFAVDAVKVMLAADRRITWAWIRIRKPSAIPLSEGAVVEYEQSST